MQQEQPEIEGKEPLLKESFNRAHGELRLRKVKSDSATAIDLMTIPADEEQEYVNVAGEDNCWSNCCDCCILL